MPVEANPIDAHLAGPAEAVRRRRSCRTASNMPGAARYDKIRDVQALLKESNADAVLLTLLDSIAWLFNIRGGDLKHTPVALAFAIVPATGRPTLFIDPAKVGDNVKGELREFVDLAEPAALMERLKALGQAKARVRLDPETAPIRFAQALKAEGAQFVPGAGPVHRCPRRSRTRPRSKARAPRICATASPWRGSSPGSTRWPSPARSTRSPRP